MNLHAILLHTSGTYRECLCAENSAHAAEALRQNALLPKNEFKSLTSVAIMDKVNRTTHYRLSKPGAQSIQEFNAEKGCLVILPARLDNDT